MDAELARRRGIEAGHSLNMIAELPHYTDDPGVPAVLQAAALDAFFVHLRLLIEFLITRPRTDRPPVISRWDYATGDLGLDNALRDRLKAASAFANLHVAHFNAARVPAADSPVSRRPSPASLAGYRRDVFTTMEALVSHLEAAGSVHAVDFGGWLADARRSAVDSTQAFKVGA